MLLHIVLLISFLSFNNTQTTQAFDSKDNTSGSINKVIEETLIFKEEESSVNSKSAEEENVVIKRKSRVLLNDEDYIDNVEDNYLFPEIIPNEDNVTVEEDSKVKIQNNEEYPNGAKSSNMENKLSAKLEKAKENPNGTKFSNIENKSSAIFQNAEEKPIDENENNFGETTIQVEVEKENRSRAKFLNKSKSLNEENLMSEENQDDSQKIPIGEIATRIKSSINEENSTAEESLQKIFNATEIKSNKIQKNPIIDEPLEKIHSEQNGIENEDNSAILNKPHFLHNFSCSGIQILDNQTLILENFFYDGLSPDAHFYLGQEKLDFETSLLITDENGKFSKLKSYRGVNVTLKTEENIFDYNHLSVWCTLDQELIGFVRFERSEDVLSPYVIKSENPNKRKMFEISKFDYTNETPMKTLTKFLNTSNGISSGNLLIINVTSIYIPNFSQKEETLKINFYVGNGEEPSEEGQVVLLGENLHLPKINNENILLTLPEEITVNDINWLSVWSEDERKSFGHVMLHSEIKPTYIQIPPLTPSDKYNYNIHSGPIIIIDTKTIFITNLHYNGKAPDAHFWAGSRRDGSEENGHILFNENNSSQPLSSYSGEDVYLTLPNYVDVKKIDYVAIWSSSLKTFLGISNISDVEDLGSLKEGKGFHQINEEGKYIARLPKCCPIYQVKTSKGCINRITSTYPMRIYEGNLTVLDDEPMQNVIYEPYLHQPNCEYGMFRMDMFEEFYLLSIGLMILPDGAVVTKDKFCYDISQIQLDEDVWSWNETMFMCFETEHVPEILNTVIVCCIYISSFFLIITSIIFIVCKEARAERGTNVMGYTTMMSLSFGCLATARILHVSGTACTVLGFIYQFFLVSSFTWLLCLSCDIFYQVWWYEKNYNKHRYKIFAGFAMGIPIAAVITSIFVNKTVPATYSKPTFGYEPCWLRSDKKVFFYYLPIAISIILNYVFITLTWFKIKKRQKNPKSDWRIRVKGIKNVFRSCYLILGIMTVCWTAEIISYYFETNNGLWIAIDIIDSLQGGFVFLVFIMHDPVIQILQTRMNCSKTRRKNRESLNLYDVAPRPPSEHGVLLSRLQHAESIEDLCSIDERLTCPEKVHY